MSSSMFKPPSSRTRSPMALRLPERPASAPDRSVDGSGPPSFRPAPSRPGLALPKLAPLQHGAYRSISDDGEHDDIAPWDEPEGVHQLKKRTSELQGAMGGLSLGGPSSSTSSSSSRSRVAPVSSTSQAVELAAGDCDPVAIKAEDLVDLGRLGEGSAGEVRKVKHRITGQLLAKKSIAASNDPAVHRQILRELNFLRECNSPYIVQYYGAFLEDDGSEIAIVMDLCQGGSLDAIYKQVKARGGRMGEKILGKVAEAALHGLDYLHSRKIIHRDIKPSNILVSRSGQVMLCDLGVSGQLVNSFAATFTGTSYYMAPERIQGLNYTITSDIWSLGLSIHELAADRFPFPPEGEAQAPLGPIELLSYIVRYDAPILVDDAQAKWTRAIKDFLRLTLEKDAKARPPPNILLQHPWIVKSQQREVDMAAFVTSVWS